MECLGSDEYAEGHLAGWNAAQEKIREKDREIAVLKELLATYKDLHRSNMSFMASMFGGGR